MQTGGSLRKVAFDATVHCLTGCAIGEVLGMVIGTALGWRNSAVVILSIVLAFVFGYSLTLRPLLASGIPFSQAARLAFAADTISIAIMEIVDTTLILIIPGAMDAALNEWLFWGSLAISLAIAFLAAFPVNLWLIGRGRGHAVVHHNHGLHGE